MPLEQASEKCYQDFCKTTISYIASITSIASVASIASAASIVSILARFLQHFDCRRKVSAAAGQPVLPGLLQHQLSCPKQVAPNSCHTKVAQKSASCPKQVAPLSCSQPYLSSIPKHCCIPRTGDVSNRIDQQTLKNG